MRILSCIMLPLILWGCSNVQLFGPNPRGSSGFNASASSSAPVGEDVREGRRGEAQKSAGSMESESVNVPSDIAGAYLSCVYEKTGQSDDRDIGQDVYCTVLKRSDNSMVDIYAFGLTMQWQLEGSMVSSESMQIAPLTNDRQYHVKLSFGKLPTAELDDLLAKGCILVRFYQGSTLLASGRSRVSALAYSWSLLNGGSFPSDGFIGGSECNASNLLGICRIARGGALYPGKLTRHFQDPAAFTRCFTTSLGQEQIYSESVSTPELKLPTEVLLLPKSDASALAWIPAQNGMIPGRALAAGHDESGQTLYICRDLEAGPAAEGSSCTNNKAGEPTPGYIASGYAGCIHEYFGKRRMGTSYEVLVSR